MKLEDNTVQIANMSLDGIYRSILTVFSEWKKE